jgi:hypothetical protein
MHVEIWSLFLGIEVKAILWVLGGAGAWRQKPLIRFLRLYGAAGSRALSKASFCAFIHGFIRKAVGFLVVFAEGVAYGEPIQQGD